MAGSAEPHHALQPEYEKFLPPPLAAALVEQYVRLKRRAWAADHEGVQETAGKVAEHALRAAQHLGNARIIGLREEISNMAEECRKLERLPRAQAPDSVRVVLPRMIAALYTLRNKRGGGHTAAEVDPGPVDALLTERMADWLMAELFRLGHELPLEQAEAVIASTVERRIPVVYRVGDFRTVLKDGLTPRDELLVLLYGEPAGATVPELRTWSKIPPTSLDRHLDALESARLIRVERGRTRRVFILPTGERRVEVEGLLEPE